MKFIASQAQHPGAALASWVICGNAQPEQVERRVGGGLGGWSGALLPTTPQDYLSRRGLG